MIYKSNIIELAQKIIKEKNYSLNTQKCYMDWIYRFIYYYEDNLVGDFSKHEFLEFICFLKEEKRLAASTINQAINALRFLYESVLNIKIDKSYNTFTDIEKHHPIILTRDEIKELLKYLDKDKWLMTCLMYGCGISISECLQLRIRDIAFKNNLIRVGNKECCRYTILPFSLKSQLLLQISKVKILRQQYINSMNYEGVFLPDSVKINNKCTSSDIDWHYLFPSNNLRPLKSKGTYIQNHFSESYLQKAIKEALRKSNISKKICCHTFRHSFAVHLIEDGYDIHIIQKLLGHKNAHSTMIYKEIAHIDIKKIVSPLNSILEN